MLSFKQFQIPQSASALFSAYASIAATAMLVRSIANEFIPQQLLSFFTSTFLYFLGVGNSSKSKFIIEEQASYIPNEIFQAAEIYLRTKIAPSTNVIKINKTPHDKNITLSITNDQEIADRFDEIPLQWRLVSTKDEFRQNGEKRQFELAFPKRHRDRVVDFYLPYVLKRAEEIREEDKIVKISSQDRCFGRGDQSGAINLHHPATFDTLAMDPELKQWIIDDLDRFIRRKDFYRKVGKAWKRGYLLYGPPGTGKSSLIAAMANYLKFDVYDLDLSNMQGNSQLKTVMLATQNRSILVIEDIDCSADIQNRETGMYGDNNKFTLSGMLNFIDGLWSCCGDERIIIFTTNHKDRLDPALLRPGRMDVHINMSYLSPRGFKALATNYLGSEVMEHPLYGEIEKMIGEMELSPAEIAEELMKSEDVNAVMEGLVEFLKGKREEQRKGKEEEILEE